MTTGCNAVTILSVNPQPQPITGAPFTVCTGLTIQLSDATLGGGWLSSNTSIAFVDPSLGIVTGIGGGSATITYTIPSGCYVTQLVTVNSSPVAIEGNFSMCVGLPTYLLTLPVVAAHGAVPIPL